MARNNDRDRGSKRAPREGRRSGKKKVCVFCTEHIPWVDYKEVNLLRRFISDRGKIRARRVTGNCTQHQREVAVAIKTARELALLPYTQRTVTERTGGRGGGRGPGGRGPSGPPAPPAAEAEVAVEVEVDVEVAAAVEGPGDADAGPEAADLGPEAGAAGDAEEV